MKEKTVAVAMSGGVDSSLAAALLKQQGFQVIGMTMDLYELPPEFCRDDGLRSCCGRGAVETANRVACSLGIPHYKVDMRRPFAEKVIDDFCAEYAAGRTPNPCIRCNTLIKFEDLFERARRLGAEYLATGHYARIGRDGEGGRLLRKAADKNKDQSYFLSGLSSGHLARALFPLGEMTKSQVRAEAERLELAAARRPESQEICFIPDNDYARFLKDRIPEAFSPGPIIDTAGRVLGRHRGIARFTVGQRRGMGIAAPYPLYVIEVRPADKTVVVGPGELLFSSSLTASGVNWVPRRRPLSAVSVRARIRHKHPEAEAELMLLEAGRARVDFSRPQRAVTPGQSVVFYDGELVLGGGVIESVRGPSS